MTESDWRTTSYIAGSFQPSGLGEQLTLRNPHNGAEAIAVEDAGASGVAEAVAAARESFSSRVWRNLSGYDRGRFLARIADEIEANVDTIAGIDVTLSGKPVRGARREVLGAARVFRYYAGAADKVMGTTIPLAAEHFNYTWREPVGVVGQITPWNFPFLAAAWKAAPALAAGCSIVLKPSPLTPVSTLALAEITRRAGLADGVFNVVVGGNETGAALVSSDVDKVSFTGSTTVGAQIYASAASRLKRVALELGGKSANLIFADADIERAALGAASLAFGNSGQSCSARTRILVQRPVLARFLAAFRKHAAALVVGDPSLETTDIGPLVSEAHRVRVNDFIAAGLREGGELVFGGRRPQSPSGGAYVEPTAFVGLGSDSVLFREEIFGPVVVVTGFDDEEEGIALAEDSQYGLAASVWTQDISRALRAVRALRVGSVIVNGTVSASENAVFAPFGGFKASGIGRELGLEGLDAYLESKNVLITGIAY